MIITTDSLDALFRQAMKLPIEPEGEAFARDQLQALMDSLLSRRDLRHDPRAQNMLLACRLRLRALQNAVLAARREEDFMPCRCELREYTQDLCAAADLLLRPLGRIVRFYAPEVCMEALCAPRDYARLVLELICNCALHCRGEAIEVTLERKRRGRQGSAITLTVACEGALDLNILHAAGARAGSGVAALRRTAWLHHGALLWLERDGRSVAALRLGGMVLRTTTPPFGHPSTEGNYLCDTPDCVELLSDPCSMVYVGLAPAVGTPSAAG